MRQGRDGLNTNVAQTKITGEGISTQKGGSWEIPKDDWVTYENACKYLKCVICDGAAQATGSR